MAPKDDSSGRLETVRTLVADDAPAVLQSICAVLDSTPSVELVGTAANGREALEMVGEQSPDLVLLDLQMPKVNGLEATARIKEHHPSIRVIIFTIHDSDLIRRACQAAGADGFVSKARGHREIAAEIKRLFPDIAPPGCTNTTHMD